MSTMTESLSQAAEIAEAELKTQEYAPCSPNISAGEKGPLNPLRYRRFAST